MSFRSRLGLAALGSYLASVGTMLAFGVRGGLPAWLNRELWGIPMGAAASVAGLVSGVCLVTWAASQRSGSAAQEQNGVGSLAERRSAKLCSAADRSYEANRTTRDVAETAGRSLGRESRATSTAIGPRSADSALGLSELASPQRVPEATVAQAVPAPDRETPVGVRGVDQGHVGRSSADVDTPTLLTPDVLVRCWRRYRDEGDGHFRAAGLRAELTECGFTVEVLEGRDVGAGDDVLVVPTGAPDGACYVVPSFAKSPGAVGRWFEDRGDRSLSRRVNDVADLAEGRRTEDGVLELRKGTVS